MAEYVDRFVVPIPKKNMPFDGQRMIFGGFKVSVAL